ncbi:MAG: DEAD/DEAH box helicase [Pseudomonadota bacterium]
MFGAIFGRKPTTAASLAAKSTVAFDANGIRYTSPASTAAEWMANPYAFAGTADLGARLAQILADGYGAALGPEVLLLWPVVYALLKDPAYGEYREALSIPPTSPARLRLASRGALGDPDFSILIDGWVDSRGRPLQPAPKLQGRVLVTAGGEALVSESLHLLLTELEKFHATSPAERTLGFKEQTFGRIRRWAADANCPVSDYVAKTILLTPDRLRLGLSRRGEGNGQVVEIVPEFDEAPAQWLSQFDKLPLRDSYDIADGASLIRVVLSPEVRSVLAEIKRMPGRRVAGPRAEAFVRNPFAALGEHAHQVLDADDFEQAQDEAGITFQRFMPHVEKGDQGQVLKVGLRVEAVGRDSSELQLLWFDTPDELEAFILKLGGCLDDGSQCVDWRNLQLEIEGDTADHLITLSQWILDWRNPALWTAQEVLDLANYSPRIESIGIERPFLTPVIARNDEAEGWFEGNVTIGLQVASADGDEPTIIPLTFSQIPSLQQVVKEATAAGQEKVTLPGLATPVPITDARRAVDALTKAQEELRRDKPAPPSGRPLPPARKRLVIKRNLEDIDYTEDRASSLRMPEERRPVVPAGLLPHVALKPHQEIGVAWLQHLWEASPDRCRGTVLADDMGLGKTLQLLTFIASAHEADPELPPALVVAPVALLENWRNELDRFFRPGTLPLLLLYGEAVRVLRVSKEELDSDLKSQGITRLLKRNWIGDAKLVLTTYETMRDLEFSLASQSWSIMVCDEAQKIKTPAALVTRSAKKQKVRFRIACTGTPVENTLADLWCLFDFVQPGMLGALNHFSRTYRQPIEAKTDEQRTKVEELRELIQPQILHRKKSDVVKDLPAPVEFNPCKQLQMSPYQHGLYKGALNTLREQRATNPSAQLQALQAIRKICSDPHGFAESETRQLPIERLVNESPKMGWMLGRLKELAADVARAHKVIVFCEFRELQLMLQRCIAAFFGIAPSIVNGDTSADPRALENRQSLIDAFQKKDGFNVIILSPLAVGFGVNIQAANHVIHFTRTWNPAKEDQATARAHRIGQTRTVTVYYPGVVSEEFPSFDVRLDALLGRKRALASDMLNGCGDLTAADFADFG